MILLAITNTCSYISKFTRFAGEAFGALIAILFLQQAVKGLVEEFRTSDVENSTWRLANGLWSLFLAFGLLLTCLGVRTARRWRFLRSPLRGLLADYGVPLLIVAWSGLSYAVTGDASDQIPSRVTTPNTWDVNSTTWSVASSMADVPGSYIAGALIPGAIIAILFFFDHNVSSQLAQQEEFGLLKPSAYHYDLLLLGGMTLMCGLLGLPPVNGVIPQSPMHTRACSAVLPRHKIFPGQKKDLRRGNTNADTPMDGEGSQLNRRMVESENERQLQLQQQVCLDINHDSNTTVTNGCSPPLHSELPQAGEIPMHGPATSADDLAVAFLVTEQRWSGLMQSLLVGACLAITPAIRCIPTAVLWGYFAFMALESLPGSQLWDRTLLLLTDPKRRYRILETVHAPYLETVPIRTIVWFTVMQLIAVGAIYGLTWAGVAGVLFPIPIMLLVPLRQYILPRIFGLEALEELDRMEQETAEALNHEEAMAEAEAMGIETFEPEEMVEEEMARYQVIHHRTHAEIMRRRTTGNNGRSSGELPGHVEGGAGAG